MFYHLLLSFLVFHGITHSESLKPRVIGGVQAWPGQFPFIAAIYVTTKTSKFFCGGALIDDDSILTSAHCVQDAEMFTIQLGSVRLEDEDQQRVVLSTSEYFIHPDFNPETLENDIGIIKFRIPVAFNIYLQPADVWDEEVADYSYVYAVGWGQVSDSNDTLSEQLQYAPINTISNTECRIYYGNQVTDNMVCAIGNYNQGTCIGDNGTPLAMNFGRFYNIVGIASFISADGCESIYPSGYTRTFPYFDWIKNVTSEA